MVSGRERFLGKVTPTASGETGLIRNKIHVYRPYHKESGTAVGSDIWLHVHNYITYPISVALVRERTISI
jgi:hypothetical protein